VKIDAFSLTAALVVGLLVPLVGALRPARWVALRPPVTGLTRPVEEGEDRRGERRGLFLGVSAVASRSRALLQSPGPGESQCRAGGVCRRAVRRAVFRTGA
jgi:hypothetical protein